MLEQIKELEKKLDQIRKDNSILEIAKSVEGLEIAISNTVVLCDALLAFYSQDNSSYFPQCISAEIADHVRNGNAQLNVLITKKDASKGQELQQNLDKLYALCLQSGILSFGLDSKKLTLVVDDAKRESQYLASKVAEVARNLDESSNKIQDMIETWKKEQGVFEQSELKKISGKSSSTIVEIEKLTEELRGIASKNREVLDSYITDAVALKDRLTQTEQTVKGEGEGISNLLEEANRILINIQEEQSKSKAAKESIEKSHENLKNEIQAKLSNADETLSQISGKHQTANEVVTAIQEKAVQNAKLLKESTDKLVADIQKERDDAIALLERIKKDAASTKLIADTADEKDKKVGEYEEQLKQLTTEYEQLNQKIENLLPGATSAGLASACKDRKDSFKTPKMSWTIVHIVSVAFLIGVGCWVLAVTKINSFQELIFFILERSPIIAAIVLLEEFARRNRNIAFRLEEDYGYKEVLASSFEGYKKQMLEIDEKATPAVST
ncbi:hypothetical protein KY329_04860, partial [Candidatus Woesearchaeota archaeon]|nr:hypothetical protein [Candidatus Woesearchaeota archaeon]